MKMKVNSGYSLSTYISVGSLVFRIIAELRILRQIESQPLILNYVDYTSYSGQFSECLSTINHFQLDIIQICCHPASFTLLFFKVKDFKNCMFSPMYTICTNVI